MVKALWKPLGSLGIHFFVDWLFTEARPCKGLALSCRHHGRIHPTVKLLSTKLLSLPEILWQQKRDGKGRTRKKFLICPDRNQSHVFVKKLQLPFPACLSHVSSPDAVQINVAHRKEPRECLGTIQFMREGEAQASPELSLHLVWQAWSHMIFIFDSEFLY